jgi:hypothetical protein
MLELVSIHAAFPSPRETDKKADAIGAIAVLAPWFSISGEWLQSIVRQANPRLPIGLIPKHGGLCKPIRRAADLPGRVPMEHIADPLRNIRLEGGVLLIWDGHKLISPPLSQVV